MKGEPATLAIVIGIVALLVGAELAASSPERRLPSDRECAALWNAPQNAPTRANVRGFVRAIVGGSLAEETYPGCGVTFMSGAGHPWSSFGVLVHDPPGLEIHWSQAGGARWLVDSPEGGPTQANATFTTHGRVVLDR